MKRLFATALATMAIGAPLAPAQAAPTPTPFQVSSRTLTSSDIGKTVTLTAAGTSEQGAIDCSGVKIAVPGGADVRNWSISGCYAGKVNLTTTVTSAMVGKSLVLTGKDNLVVPTTTLTTTATIGSQTTTGKLSLGTQAPTLLLTGKGTSLAGVGAHVTIVLDGKAVGTTTITNQGTYAVKLPRAITATDKVGILFDNDAASATEDRNLYLSGIKTSDGLVLDPSASTYYVGGGLSLTSGDVRTYTGVMPWGGALVWNSNTVLGKPGDSLTALRDKARAMRTTTSTPVTVSLAPGRYTGNLVLDSRDSNVTWTGKGAVIDGSTTLSGGHAVTDATALATMPKASAVTQFDLARPAATFHAAGFGVPNSGLGWSEVTVGSTLATDAQWPETGWATTVRAVENKNDNVAIDFAVDGKPTMRNDQGVMLTAYPGVDWADVTAPATVSGDRVTTTTKSPFGMRNGQRVKFRNVAQALDKPGEYVWSADGTKLFVYAPAGVVSITTATDDLVSASGATNVTFKDITLSSTLGNGIEASGATGWVVDGVTVTKTGSDGIVLNGTGNTVRNTTVTDSGRGGIVVSGGDRTSLTSSKNVVESSTVRRTGRVQRQYTPGISAWGVGTTIRNNTLEDMPNQAVNFGGNNHVVENNEIARVQNESADAGAIYTGRDWSWGGTVIRNNHIHDVTGYADKAGMGVTGIYLDDMVSGVTVTGNKIENTYRGILLGGGRNNVITDNTISGAKEAIHADQRGVDYDWAVPACSVGGVLRTNLAQVPYTSTAWKAQFPWLSTLLTDEPCSPKYNVITGNYWTNSGDGWIADQVISKGTVKDNGTPA